MVEAVLLNDAGTCYGVIVVWRAVEDARVGRAIRKLFVLILGDVFYYSTREGPAAGGMSKQCATEGA